MKIDFKVCNVTFKAHDKIFRNGGGRFKIWDERFKIREIIFQIFFVIKTQDL